MVNNEKKSPPSYVTLDFDTYGNLSGGFFGEDPIVLKRYIMEYAADDEDNVMGFFRVYPSAPYADVPYLNIVGFANSSLHGGINCIELKIPMSESDNTGFCVYDSENPEHGFATIPQVTTILTGMMS